MRKGFGVLLVLALAAMPLPAAAATFAIFGSAWDSKDADNVGGGGLSAGWGLGHVLDFQLRASYFEQLKSDPLEDYLIQGNSPFVDAGLKALPVELGVAFNIGPRDEGVWHPQLGAGVAYYVLDSDFGNLDDEFGYYASFANRFGDGHGADFYAEFTYRFVEGTVSDLGDLNGDGISDDFDVDLGGPVGNIGVVWSW
jgi:hypothetical protein